MSALAYRLRLRDSYGVTPLGVILIALSSIGALILILFLSILYGGRAAGRTICRHWSDQTGIPTKFEVLYWADTGTCLARTPDGRWVLNTKVQVYIPGGKP
jgi:hypothetical protein